MQFTIVSAWAALILNCTQAIVKCGFGFFAGSHALFADGLHGCADVVVDIIILIAAIFSSKPADNNYPYGRGRYESLGILIVSIALCFAGFELLLHMTTVERVDYTMRHTSVIVVSCVSAVSSILAYLWMKWYAIDKNDLVDSNATHQLVDALSSLVVLLSAVSDQWGYAQSDTIATVIVILFIVYSMLPFVKTAFFELTDHATDVTHQMHLRKCILAMPGIDEIHHLRTRKSASRILLDAHITLNHHLSFTESHWIAEKLTTYIKELDPSITDVLIHADPDVELSRHVLTRDGYIAFWSQEGIAVDALKPEVFLMHYLRDTIHVDWKPSNGYDRQQYALWAEKIKRMSPEIRVIRLWSECIVL